MKTKKIRLHVLSILTIGILMAWPSFGEAQTGLNKDSVADEMVTWKTNWSNGIQIKSSDNKYKFKIGGRIMNDWETALSYDQSIRDSLGGATNGAEFRRARFFHSGTIDQYISYKLQFDFAGGDADLKDAYIKLGDIPYLGSMKIGHFKEPFGLEELTSSKYISFMARSLTSAFTPSRNTGLMFSDAILGDRMTWAIGAFRDVNGYGETTDQEHRFHASGRITSLAFTKGENLLHLGLAYQMLKPDNNLIQYAQEPETHMQVDFVNTGDISDVSSESILGTELATVIGPFSVQGEYQRATLSRNIQLSDGNESIGKSVNHHFTSFYAYASMFLTRGDHRFYDAEDGAFSRVKPHKNFRENGGIGALELALRFSGINLNDGEETVTEGSYSGSSLIEGGQLNNVTLGLNWYINPNSRIMFNYVYSDLTNRDGLSGKAGFLRTRFQIDF